MAAKKDYFGLDFIISLILTIFAPAGYVCSIITRVLDGKIVAAIVRFFLYFPVIWLLDIYYMVTKKEICRLIDM